MNYNYVFSKHEQDVDVYYNFIFFYRRFSFTNISEIWKSFQNLPIIFKLIIFSKLVKEKYFKKG